MYAIFSLINLPSEFYKHNSQTTQPELLVDLSVKTADVCICLHSSGCCDPCDKVLGLKLWIGGKMVWY